MAAPKLFASLAYIYIVHMTLFQRDLFFYYNAQLNLTIALAKIALHKSGTTKMTIVCIRNKCFYFYTFYTGCIHLDNTKKPGPGEYYPENVLITKPNAPKISLGIRHSEFMTPLILEVDS